MMSLCGMVYLPSKPPWAFTAQNGVDAIKSGERLYEDGDYLSVQLVRL